MLVFSFLCKERGLSECVCSLIVSYLTEHLGGVKLAEAFAEGGEGQKTLLGCFFGANIFPKHPTCRNWRTAFGVFREVNFTTASHSNSLCRVATEPEYQRTEQAMVVQLALGYTGKDGRDVGQGVLKDYGEIDVFGD
jgi:hypothetical protein